MHPNFPIVHQKIFLCQNFSIVHPKTFVLNIPIVHQQTILLNENYQHRCCACG